MKEILKKTESETISIQATSKETLILFLKEGGAQIDNKDDNFILLHVKRSDCGCERSYKTVDDIPETNVTCEHGNKIILYTD